MENPISERAVGARERCSLWHHINILRTKAIHHARVENHDGVLRWPSKSLEVSPTLCFAAFPLVTNAEFLRTASADRKNQERSDK